MLLQVQSALGMRREKTVMIHIIATAHAGSQIDNCIEQAIMTCGLVYLSPDHELPSEQLVKLRTGRDFHDSRVEGGVNDNSVGEVEMTFVFNGVKVTVRANSDPELIRRDWLRARYGKIDKEVGPYPNPVLTDEEMAHDAEVDAELERNHQKRQAQYDAEVKTHRERVEARLDGAAKMELSDKEEWDRALPQLAKSIYGTSTASYAERWARLMQLELANGKELADIWEETLEEADLEGMTGFSTILATHLLTVTWVHGGELRKLHNAYWGSDSEEGTVNPAVLTINKSKSAESNVDLS